MLKKGKYTMVDGKEYRIFINDNNTVNLVTDNSEALQMGFNKELSTGRYVKTVSSHLLNNVYRISTYGTYKNSEFNVHNENHDQYLVGTSDAIIAKSLNLNRSDKYYYEGWIPKHDVKVFERKEDVSL